MAKKQNKVKQVASRAKRTPRTEANVSSNEQPKDFKMGQTTEDNTLVMRGVSGTDEIEFSVESRETLRTNAIERAKRVDLRAEIKQHVKVFHDAMDARLKGLADQIESQMKPLVQAIADIAVAKNVLDSQLKEFEATLSVTLNLNDELEPIEISNMFSSIDPVTDELLEADADLDPNTVPLVVAPTEEEEELFEMLEEATEAVHGKPVN